MCENPSLWEISRELRHRVHLERRDAIRRLAGSALRGTAQGLRTAFLWSVRLVRRLVAEQRRRRDLHRLYQFDDRALADIGVTRGELEFITRYGLPESHPRRAPALRRQRPGVPRRRAIVPARTVDK